MECFQVTTCVLEGDEDDESKIAASGVVFKMLKDYSDFFGTMQAAAAITDDEVMQPFVAWYFLHFYSVFWAGDEMRAGTARRRWRGDQPRAAASSVC